MTIDQFLLYAVLPILLVFLGIFGFVASRAIRVDLSEKHEETNRHLEDLKISNEKITNGVVGLSEQVTETLIPTVQQVHKTLIFGSEITKKTLPEMLDSLGISFAAIDEDETEYAAQFGDEGEDTVSVLISYRQNVLGFKSFSYYLNSPLIEHPKLWEAINKLNAHLDFSHVAVRSMGEMHVLMGNCGLPIDEVKVKPVVLQNIIGTLISLQSEIKKMLTEYNENYLTVDAITYIKAHNSEAQMLLEKSSNK